MIVLLLIALLSSPLRADFEDSSGAHKKTGGPGTNTSRWVCYVEIDAKVRSEDRRCGKKKSADACSSDSIRCEWDREKLHCSGKTFARCKRQGHGYCSTYRFSKGPFQGTSPQDGRLYRCDAGQAGEPLVPLKD